MSGWRRGPGVAPGRCAVVSPQLVGDGVCVTELGEGSCVTEMAVDCVTTILNVTAESLPSSCTSPAAEKWPQSWKDFQQKTRSWDKNVGSERVTLADPGRNPTALHPQERACADALTHTALRGPTAGFRTTEFPLQDTAVKFPSLAWPFSECQQYSPSYLTLNLCGWWGPVWL